MLSPPEILNVVRELVPQLPDLLGEKAFAVQHQIEPLMKQLAAGKSNGTDVLEVLWAYPAVAEKLQQKLDLQKLDDESSLENTLRSRSFQNLPGVPSSAIPGQRYICPVPDCPEAWFRRGNQSPKICEEHGVIMVPAADDG